MSECTRIHEFEDVCEICFPDDERSAALKIAWALVERGVSRAELAPLFAAELKKLTDERAAAEAAYADLRATSIATLRFQESERAEAAEARLAALLQSARDLVEDADNRALSASEMLNMLDGWVTRHSAPAQPGRPKADP